MASNLSTLRGNSSQLDKVVKKDGQLLFTTDNGHIYLDNGNNRIEFYKQDLDALNNAIAEEKAKLQQEINDIGDKLGTLPDDKTITDLINESKYDDSALDARVIQNTNDIATLKGTGEGSISKEVADQIAAIVAGADEDFDTLKEISDWIKNHGQDAAAMNTAINANKEAIEKLNGDATTEGSVENKITVALDGLDGAFTIPEGYTITAINQVNGKVEVVTTKDAGVGWGEFEDLIVPDTGGEEQG